MRIDRRMIEVDLYSTQPLLKSEFCQLHKDADDHHRLALTEPAVVSFLLDWEQLEIMTNDLTKRCHQGRFIYDSDVLEHHEVAFASVADSLDGPVCASMWIDWRRTFLMEDLHGVAGGFIDFELSSDAPRAAGELRKRPLIADSRDFWAWKRRIAEKRPSNSQLVLFSYLDIAPLPKLGFGGTAPQAASLGATFWQDWFEEEGIACVVLLPHIKGIQVSALLPRSSASQLKARYSDTSVWHPRPLSRTRF